MGRVLTERVTRHHRPAQFQTLGAAAATPNPQGGHAETIRPPEAREWSMRSEALNGAASPSSAPAAP